MAAFETGASDYPKHLPMPHRPVSTPAHPASLAHQQNLGHLTFGANITAFSEHQESNLDLSTIPECSHESDRSRTDSERSTDGVDLASLSSTVFRFDPFNSNTKSKCVDRVTPEISSTKGFLRINGPIPHLNGGKDICLGIKCSLLIDLITITLGFFAEILHSLKAFCATFVQVFKNILCLHQIYTLGVVIGFGLNILLQNLKNLV